MYAAIAPSFHRPRLIPVCVCVCACVRMEKTKKEGGREGGRERLRTDMFRAVLNIHSNYVPLADTKTTEKTSDSICVRLQLLKCPLSSVVDVNDCQFFSVFSNHFAEYVVQVEALVLVVLYSSPELHNH